MDVDKGLFIDKPADIDAATHLESFEYGETVQVKDGFFEVVKISTRDQRLILKPIPKPSMEGG